MKRMLMVLISAASTVCAGAQVQFGVKAGYNLANFTTSPAVPGLTYKSDFNAGVMASIPLFSSSSLQPEIMYSGQGDNFSTPSTTGKSNIDYLNIPVLFKYQHTSGLFAETGPQVGFLLSANETADGKSYNTKNITQPIDFSWAFGIGYKLPLGLGIDARYNLGLTNTIKSSSGINGTAKNSAFQFGLFYIFKGL